MTSFSITTNVPINRSKTVETNKAEADAKIRQVFGELNLGELDRVDIVQATSRGMDVLKIFIHYSSTTPDGEALRARLAENEVRQKDGEIFPPIKIVYARTWKKDLYWQIYKCKTPAERLAEQTAAAAFRPRIEM
jgi:hypothetical protein